MLNDVRVGRLTARALATIAGCVRPPEEAGGASGVRPTKLFTHRADCDEVNSRELCALDAPAVVLRAFDSGGCVRAQSPTALLDGCAAKANLKLRAGPQVLLLRSISQAEGLTNGARGVVTRFDQGLPVVRFACGVERRVERQPFLVVQDGRCVAMRSQVPLLSVHRSQGLSLDALEVSLDRAVEYGQAYVALSRARSLRGLHVRAFDPSAVRAHPDVLDFHDGIARRAAKEAAKEAAAAAACARGDGELDGAGVGDDAAVPPTVRAGGPPRTVVPLCDGDDDEGTSRMKQRLAQLRRERRAYEVVNERV
jgi:ATP-dependent DNA helicase PIF1